jgi:hypothetical protein
MELHHSKHHKAYVDGANAAVTKLEELRESGDYAALNGVEKNLAFHLGGHTNHSVFWKNMSPDGGGQPEGEVAAAITEYFGGFEKFQAHFTAAATGIQGSGWAVLSWDPIGEQLVNALRMNLDTGGSELTRSLDDLAELAQGELEIRALIRVEQFRTVITAQVLAAEPLAILLYLRLTSPRSVAAFDQPFGQLVLLLCAASCVVGYLVMVRAGSIPERPRLFSEEGEARG